MSKANLQYTTIHNDGLGEVELRQGLDLFEALVLWSVQPKAHCVHPRLSIVGRLRRPLQSRLVSRIATLMKEWYKLNMSSYLFNQALCK